MVVEIKQKNTGSLKAAEAGIQEAMSGIFGLLQGDTFGYSLFIFVSIV
jgi:hypothetical protein